jgi:hypothetical protein
MELQKSIGLFHSSESVRREHSPARSGPSGRPSGADNLRPARSDVSKELFEGGKSGLDPAVAVMSVHVAVRVRAKLLRPVVRLGLRGWLAVQRLPVRPLVLQKGVPVLAPARRVFPLREAVPISIPRVPRTPYPNPNR